MLPKATWCYLFVDVRWPNSHLAQSGSPVYCVQQHTTEFLDHGHDRRIRTAYISWLFVMPEKATPSKGMDSCPIVVPLKLLFEQNPEPSPFFMRLPLGGGQLLVRFVLSSELVALFEGELVTTYPDSGREKEHACSRHRFAKDHAHQWSVSMCVERSGTFEFYVKHENGRSRSGFFQVPPILRLPNNRLLSPDEIVLQTVISKWMGPIAGWAGQLRVLAQMGYNMIHFTPLQRRGTSNSPYSIHDQLSLSPDLFEEARSATEEEKSKELRAMLGKMENEMGLLSMIDVVWNHTSSDTPWLAEHPEVGYTLANSPHLRMAYELDEGILAFSRGLEAAHGLDPYLNDDSGLEEVLRVFRQEALPKLALWEYFVVNLDGAAADLEAKIRSMSTEDLDNILECKTLSAALVADGRHARHSLRMDIEKALGYFKAKICTYITMADKAEQCSYLSEILLEYRRLLDGINLPLYREYDSKVDTIMDNLYHRAHFEHVAEHGPRLNPVSEKHPLVPIYFTRVKGPDGSPIVFANNGWIWDADPLVNFAESPSEAYFLRDLIVWGDCVKLRYGHGPADSPWLWEHMTAYTQLMASLFHGFRIDNCHSTPMHVANYLLTKAREARPELYVCAELFTGSEERDMLFVTNLGLNSLIREAMAAWDVNELARYSQKYGGQPLGSVVPSSEHVYAYGLQQSAMLRSNPHALFMDCTHDNQTPFQKRTAEDALSNAAIVAMTSCAIGSVHGYDQLVPYHLNLVNEQRTYEPLTLESGIAPAKKLLHELHQRLVQEECCETHVAQEHDLVLLTRENPQSHNGYLLIARPSFSEHSDRSYTSLQFEDCDLGVLFGGRLEVRKGLSGDPQFIGGLGCNVECWSNSAVPADFVAVQNTVVVLDHFPAGSFVVISKKPAAKSTEALEQLHCQLESTTGLAKIIDALGFADLNMLLYRCDEEEADAESTPPFATTLIPPIGPNAVYKVPEMGPLAFCGLQGFQTAIDHVIAKNDLTHPLCGNLRAGSWAMEYITNRLQRKEYPRLEAVVEWLTRAFLQIDKLPKYLVPKYFIWTISTVYHKAVRHALSLMSPTVLAADSFVQKLALGSVQLVGHVNSTGLAPQTPSLPNQQQIQPCLAAGLPHFSTHHMRVWGRDVFISFRGLFLLTGRFGDAHAHLLAFAGCAYRGLIPNLLDSGRYPRFNARDATWWFMQALQDYCTMAPDGKAILDEAVRMRFEGEQYIAYADPKAYSKAMKISDLVQDIMQRHATGISFREWNAGPQLDHMMRSEGFDISVGLGKDGTGFIYGGNEWNCGTWMDKMGESSLAGNMGVPATPRDGAPVELIGLLKSALRWLVGMPERFKGVVLDDKTLTYGEWNDCLQASFERRFYLAGHFKHSPKEGLERSMYKDTVGSRNPDCDCQLRPNFLIAMVHAPELFDADHARSALLLCADSLTGPLGMRTLSPADPNYRPDYNQADESSDYATSKGFNYHQGPEWLWLTGYFLRAWILFFGRDFADRQSGSLPVAMIRRMVLEKVELHRLHLETSPWCGLPELTNGEGRFCQSSCASQAWSMGTMIEALVELDRHCKSLVNL